MGALEFHLLVLHVLLSTTWNTLGSALLQSPQNRVDRTSWKGCERLRMVLGLSCQPFGRS